MMIVDQPAPGVRRLTIDNVRRRGALSPDLLRVLVDAVRTAPDDTACLVLTGTGQTFCAGYDLRELDSPPDPDDADVTIAPEHLPCSTR